MKPKSGQSPGGGFRRVPSGPELLLFCTSKRSLVFEPFGLSEGLQKAGKVVLQRDSNLRMEKNNPKSEIRALKHVTL